MAQADAEDGQLPLELLHHPDHGLHILGVSGAVGQEQAVGAHFHNLLGGGVVGHHGDIAALFIELADNVQLHAAVHRHHIKAVVGGPGVPALFGGHPGNHIVGNLVVEQQLVGVGKGQGGVADEHLLAALIPDDPGDHAGVHPADAGDAVLVQHLGKGLGIPEIGGKVVVLPDNQAAHGGHSRLIVFLGHAVVADEGIGHTHHLVGIGGVGDDLLVAHHRGIEHQLVHSRHMGAEPVTVELPAVFQDNLSVVRLHPHSFLS